MKGKWLDMMTRAEDECLYLKHQSGSTENELVMLRGFATSILAASDIHQPSRRPHLLHILKQWNQLMNWCSNATDSGGHSHSYHHSDSEVEGEK